METDASDVTKIETLQADSVGWFDAPMDNLLEVKQGERVVTLGSNDLEQLQALQGSTQETCGQILAVLADLVDLSGEDLDNDSAIDNTVEVPLALSNAPLYMLSPFTGLPIPM